MKSSYIVRARRFIRMLSQFMPVQGCISVRLARIAVDNFNARYNRHVRVEWGSARLAFITSDYVVKMDYDPEAVALFGGCDSECRFYRYAMAEGMEYLFAEITPYACGRFEYYIMPRVSCVGAQESDYLDRLSGPEYRWLMRHVHDLHEYNYGILHGDVVIIDYALNCLFEPEDEEEEGE